jgi:hypothetical protein
MSEAQRLEDKIDSLAEMVADLRVAVARVEERQAVQAPKPGLVRDGAITLSGSALGGAILFLIQHLTGK